MYNTRYLQCAKKEPGKISIVQNVTNRENLLRLTNEITHALLTVSLNDAFFVA